MGEAGSKPLEGKRVMVTRAADQSGPLVNALRDAGAEAVVVPLVAFAPPDDLAALDGYLREGGRFDWVFLTSQNAVRALEERCAALGISLGESLSGAKIAAVGPATAEAARSARLEVHYISKTHNGVAMAAELTAGVQGKRVFVPRSDRANPDLITVLEKNGAKVTSAVAYRTIAAEADTGKVQEIVAERKLDAVLFFSPSAVHHLCGIVGAERFLKLGRQAAFVAIGPVSERALKEEGVERVLAAADTTVAASIAMLAEFFSKAGPVRPLGAKPR